MGQLNYTHQKSKLCNAPTDMVDICGFDTSADTKTLSYHVDLNIGHTKIVSTVSKRTK